MAKKPTSYSKTGGASKRERGRSPASAKMVWVKTGEIQAKPEPLVAEKCKHGKKPKKCKDCADGAEWSKIRFDYGWRKVNSRHWWAHDLGSATHTPEGWVASASGYEGVILDPKVGPFKTAQEAMVAWTKKRRNVT